MMYHAIIIKHADLDDCYAVVRPAIDGINDTEWELGCRIYAEAVSNEELLCRQVERYYQLVNMDAWTNILESIQDQANVTNNSFINSNVKPDKWEQRPEIY